MISGIAWVSELIEAAGGIDISTIAHLDIGSWCGKKFRPRR
jgi:hypothetical protein